MKVNSDDKSGGKPDYVALVGMADVGGLNSTTMKPVSNRKVIYLRYFGCSEFAIRSIWAPYVASIVSLR